MNRKLSRMGQESNWNSSYHDFPKEECQNEQRNDCNIPSNTGITGLIQHISKEKIQPNRENCRIDGCKMCKTDEEYQNDERKKEINMDEHKVPMDVLVARLNTNLETGLTESAAKQKFAEDGPNRLTPPRQIPRWVLLIATQTGFFSLFLWFGAILCFIGYKLKNEQENLYLGVALVAVVTLTGLFKFYQDCKSSSLMDSFKNMMPTKTTVIRDGKAADIDAINLVRGDIIKIKAGDKVPADVRIVNCSDDMKVNNGSLTGESEPIKRQSKNTHENPLETHNLAFFDTYVVSGEASCLVIRIGDRTLMGKIAHLSLTTENVEIPIAKEIEHFIQIVSAVAVLLGVTLFIIGVAVGTDPLTNLVFMIGIIFANVPEGLLTIVTVCLTLTAKRMHSKSVLVKNLEGVETLGSTSCICSDKTGTLTQNIMSVAHLVFDQQIWDVESTMTTENFDDADPSFKALLRCATVCNTAVWDEGSKKDGNGNPVPFQQDVTMGDGSIEHRVMWKPIGDASESALIKFAQTKTDIMEYRDQVTAHRGGTIPFNPTNKYQVQIARDSVNGQWVDLVKGAPERVAARCTTILINGKEIPITPEHLKQIKNHQLQLSRRGMRVLAFAEKVLDMFAYPYDYMFNAEACNFPLGESEQQYAARKEITDAAGEDAPSVRMKEGLCYIGMMALIDPPRPQVPSAIAKCKTAGIKVIMITGDHPETAKAVARKVGIIWGDTCDDIQHFNEVHGLKIGDAGWEDPDMAPAIVVPGWDISVDTPEDVWDDILAHPQVVFARISPQQKRMVVENCQRRRHVVTVTGDGVNDAPALKKADVGIAMGIMGTDVSKEAADMILLDDNFASIVSGIEEGRLIFDNLKKSIAYMLSSSVPEISPFLAFIVVQIPLPLSAVLIIYVDLCTGIVPAISMAWENPETDIMTRNPRDTNLDRLVTKKLVSFAYFQIGVIQALAGFFSYLVVLNDYGYAPWLLPGLHAVDNWQKLTLYCKVENGAWKNYAGEICPCFNDHSMSKNLLCRGLGELWFTSEAANNRFITRCQQMGYNYWDQDATIKYNDVSGIPRETPLGTVSTCAYPMRNIRMTGKSREYEPSTDDFSIMNPASYFTDKLYTGSTTLISKPSKLALRGGAECTTDTSLISVEHANGEEHCGFYYEYSPFRGVQSQFFERNWGTESVFTSSVIGLGSETPASVVLNFQPVGTWHPNEASAVAGRNVDAGHISNVVAVSTDEKNKFRTVETTYTSGYLDQTTTLETVLDHSSNKLANEFWDEILPGLAGDDLTRARATLQAKRCQNLCTSQPGFTEMLLAYDLRSSATAQMAADMKAISDANLQPECKEEVFKTFIANFDAGFGRCYEVEGSNNADEMLVVNVASRQLQKEALHNAQCAWFIGIIIVQLAHLVICKTRWLSIREQGMRNQVMNFALVFEVILGSLLCYILPIGIALGTRPLRVTHWFTAMPFSILILVYDELRKYGMRRTSRNELDVLTGRSVRHPGWLERNFYY